MTVLSPLSRRAGLGALAVTALAATAFTAPAAANGPVVLSVGHVDPIDIAYEAGEFELSVHDETVEPDVERDPATVLFRVKSEAAVEVPADPLYAFLGAPGDTVHVLPEVEDESLLWAGLGTEEIEPGALVGDSVKVIFTKVVGPGDFSLFDTAITGDPNVLVDSGDGLPDVVTLPVGTHAHANWAFEEPGRYRITYKVVARDAATNQRVVSDSATLRFQVRP
jgi:surface-anchored protein